MRQRKICTWLFFICAMPCCSLLFSPSSESADAGMAIDAASARDSGADAKLSTSHCGVDLDGTLAYFSVDNQDAVFQFTSLEGSYVAHSRLLSGIPSAPFDGMTPLNTTEGPGGQAICDEAAGLDGINNNSFPFIRIPHHADYENIQSLDFWFYPRASGTLLAKDKPQTHDGDFALDGIRYDSEYELRIRLQTVANPTCSVTSRRFATQAWHHVAISFSGTNGLKIFVDGMEPDLRNTCIADLKNNKNDWLWGASNANSVVNNPFKGRLDELRFRDEPISQEQALKIYQAIDLP